MTNTQQAFDAGAAVYERAKREGFPADLAMREALRMVKRVCPKIFRALRLKAERTKAGRPALPLYVADIINDVAIRHSVDTKWLTGPSRIASLVKIRDEACWLMRRRGLSTPLIGEALNRDHSSIAASLRRFEKRIAGDEVLRQRMTKAAERAAA